MFAEVFDAIHAEGAFAGVHCCGNTDWSVLLSAGLDILNLDAYEYLDTLALYPSDLRSFLDSGGVVALGLIPTGEALLRETSSFSAAHLQNGLQTLCTKAGARGVNLTPADFADRSLLAPSCGLGSVTPEHALRVLDTLVTTAEILQAG